MGPDIDGPSVETLRWAEDAMNPTSEVLKVRPLQRDGMAVHVVDMTVMGLHTRVVLRRFVDADRLASDPWYVPANEVAVVKIAESAAIRMPSLLASDLVPDRCEVPTLLYNHLDGREPTGRVRNLDSFLEQLAEGLVAIHAIDLGAKPAALPHYERYTPLSELEAPAWSAVPATWERIIELVAGPEPATPRGFIHRDYHPQNTLWRKDGTMTGTVDWTAGSWGPRAIDVARMRQNLAWDYSIEAADSFLQRYESLSGGPVVDLDYWELVDVADGAQRTIWTVDEDDGPSIKRFDAWLPTLL